MDLPPIKELKQATTHSEVTVWTECPHCGVSDKVVDGGDPDDLTIPDMDPVMQCETCGSWFSITDDEYIIQEFYDDNV